MRARSMPRLVGSALGLIALAASAGALIDYSDPWGLPSGTATLKLASQQAIGSGAHVYGFDFASGEVDSTLSYLEILAAGHVDLIYIELHPDSSSYFFRAPEDGDQFDRYLIASLGDSVDIDGITTMEGVHLTRFAAAAEGFAYVLLQIQEGAAPETTAVKFEVTALADSTATFDWVWQPNGSLDFVPTATSRGSLSALKALFAH